jgi:hypothetical protein
MERPPELTLASGWRHLPAETQFRILLELPVEKLLAMCQDNNEGVCDDYLFWKQKLQVDGFDLRANFDQFVDMMKRKDQSRADFIKNFFYIAQSKVKNKFVAQFIHLQVDLFRTYRANRDESETSISFFELMTEDLEKNLWVSMRTAGQLCLDLDYYLLQIRTWQNGKPEIFYLGLKTPSRGYLSWADYNKEIIAKGRISGDIPYINSELFEGEFDIEENPLWQYLEELKIQLTGQTLDALSWLLQEGDIITYGHHGPYFFISNFQGQNWMTEIENKILPEVSVPFLIQQGIVDLDQLGELYKHRIILIGFHWRGKNYDLAQEGEPYDKLTIEGHTFHVIKKKEPKMPPAPIKKKPLVRKNPAAAFRQPRLDQD